MTPREAFWTGVQAGLLVLGILGVLAVAFGALIVGVWLLG
jgi:hypothetical protein